MRHNTVRNIDSEIVDRIASASLRHEGKVPGTVVSRSRVCGIREGNRNANCRYTKRKNFHFHSPGTLTVTEFAMKMVKRLVL
jgi:hypothetical protein